MKNAPYQQAIGSLMYAALATRPDIMYSVSLLSRFMKDPGRVHWAAVKRVICYLKGTKNVKLTYGAIRTGFCGYADSDWGSQRDWHSISGYVYTLDGGAISWSSKKQAVVSLSSTEAEYVAATHAAKEALWYRQFFREVSRPLSKPVLIYSDNQGAIALTKDDRYHARTKHIDIRYHFIREAVERNRL